MSHSHDYVAEFPARDTSLATAILVGSWAAYTTRGIRPRAQFFRSVERALKNALFKTHPQAPVIALNFVGDAARSLFRDLRRGRSRSVPPAVSDWAESLARCLIDVQMVRKDRYGDRLISMRDYAQFIYDAATVVAVRREGLLPALREAYARDLPMPSDENFAKRNSTFLHPLREFPRWVFFKDLVYPIAAWLSLAVSLVALWATWPK